MAATQRYIHLFPGKQSGKHELSLFASKHWTKETEENLISRIEELFAQVRPHAKTFRLNLQVEVNDATDTVLLLHIQSGSCDNPAKEAKLTERELQIIELIAQGFTNKEIARQLYISIETVRSHRKHVMLKTNAKNTAMLIKCYDELLARM